MMKNPNKYHILGLKVGTEISKENDLVKIGNNETLKYDSYFGNKILLESTLESNHSRIISSAQGSLLLELPICVIVITLNSPINLICCN